MVKFACPQCASSFAGDVKQVGRRFKCPKCSHEFRIPAEKSASTPASSTRAAKTKPVPARPIEIATPSRAPRPLVVEVKFPEKAPTSTIAGKRIVIGAVAGLGVLAAVVTFMLMSGGDPQNPTTPTTPTTSAPPSNTSDPIQAIAAGTVTPSNSPPNPVAWSLPTEVEKVARESLELAMQELGPVKAPIPPNTAIALAKLHARLGNAAEAKKILEASAEPKVYSLYSADSPEPYGVRAARIAAEAQDIALALQMFDSALEELKVLDQHPQPNRVFGDFFSLLRAQLELGDLAGAKVTVDAWRRIAASFSESGQPHSAFSSNLLLAGTLGDLKELDAVLAVAPKLDGHIAIETWVYRHLIEAKQFDAVLFLLTDPRITTRNMPRSDAGTLVRAVLATGDIDGAIRMAEGLTPSADAPMFHQLSQGWDQIVAALAARGELDRALGYTSGLEPPFERTMAAAMLAPYFAKAGRLDEIRKLQLEPPGRDSATTLLPAVLARLDGDAARYDELMKQTVATLSTHVHERLAAVLLNVGDVDGAGRILANQSLWMNYRYRDHKQPLSARPVLSEFVKAGNFDSFLDTLKVGLARQNDRNSPLYWALDLMLPPAAAAGKSDKTLELALSGGFMELMPDIVAAKAAAGDLAGARAAIASIDNLKEDFGYNKPMLRAQAHAKIALAMIPLARPPVSLAGGRPGMATLDLPTAAHKTAQFAIPAKPDLAGVINLAQQHILDGAADNAILLAQLARLQIELGDKDGANQSLARAQQTAPIVPNAASRIESFLQIALARAAAGDAQGARSALSSCVDATALLNSRHERMDALVALHTRLQNMKEPAWAALIADGAAQVAGDLNDEKLQVSLAHMRLKAGNIDAVATIMKRHNLRQFFREDELIQALADFKDIARIKQFIETASGRELTYDFWGRIASALALKEKPALAKEAIAQVPLRHIHEHIRVLQVLDAGAAEDDYILATYEKLIPELERETPRGAGHELNLAHWRSQLDRAAARTLVRAGRVKVVRAYYSAIPGAETSYLHVLERLAPAAHKAGDNALYAELLTDFKAHYDKIPAGIAKTRDQIYSLANLANEQFAAGDKVGGNASIDAALALNITTPVVPLEAALVAAGRTEEAIRLFPPKRNTKPVPKAIAEFDKLLAGGQYASAQRVALQHNERSRYIDAIATQARSGDVEGAVKAVVALHPIAWRGHVPYAILAVGQGLIARDRLASIEAIKAPVKIELISDLPVTAAKPDTSLKIPSTGGLPGTVVIDKDDPATVEGWIAMLDDPNANRRGMGIKLLQNAGSKSFPGIKRLGQLARSDPSSVIRASAEAAANTIFERAFSDWMNNQTALPEPADVMGKQLGEFFTDRSMRRALRLRMLSRVQTWSARVKAEVMAAAALGLCQALDDIDDGERYAEIVGTWAAIKDTDTAAFKLALAHQNPAIRAAAMRPILRNIEAFRPAESTSALERHRLLLLASPFPDVREAGLTAIGQISLPAFPLMVGMMKTTDINARARIAVMLAITAREPLPDDFANQNPEAAAILIEATKDTDFATRKAATIVARSLKLVSSPPPQPQPRSAPGAPDDVVVGNRMLSLTEAVTPAVVVQVMSRKDQSVETKRMFAQVYANRYENQQAAEAMIPYLPTLIAEGGGDIRFTLGNALSRDPLGPKVPARQRDAILKALKDAIKASPMRLGTNGTNDPMLWAIQKLEAPPSDDRARFGPQPKFKNNNEARTVLRKGDSGMTHVSLAMQYLSQAKAHDADTINAIIAVLDHGNMGIRMSAASYLREIGPTAAVALNPLMKQFKEDPDPQVRSQLAYAIFAIGPQSPVAEQLAIELLGIRHGPGHDYYKFIAAIESIRLMEFEAEVRWQEILERLNKPYLFDARQPFPQVGTLSRLSSLPPEELKKMRVPQAIPDALKSPRIDTRAKALEALGQLGVAADSVAPAIVALLKDEERDIQLAAISTLAKIERAQDLVAIMDSEDDLQQMYASDALGRLGPKAAAALPALEEKLKTSNLSQEQKRNIEGIITMIKAQPPRNPPQQPRTLPR